MTKYDAISYGFVAVFIALPGCAGAVFAWLISGKSRPNALASLLVSPLNSIPASLIIAETMGLDALLILPILAAVIGFISQFLIGQEARLTDLAAGAWIFILLYTMTCTTQIRGLEHWTLCVVALLASHLILRAAISALRLSQARHVSDECPPVFESTSSS